MDRDFEDYDQQNIGNLISRFEELVSGGNEAYFDIEEFEDIIDYYEANNNTKYLDKALATAGSIHPYHSYFQLKKAQRLGLTNQYRKALKILQNIIASEPDNLAALQNMAYIYSRHGFHRESIKVHHEIIKKGGFKHEAWFNIAIAYQLLEKFEIALNYLKRIVENFPEEDSALYDMMYCYESLNDMESAAAYFTEFIDKNPYSVAAWFNLGIVYSNSGLFEKSIEAYDYVIAIEEYYSSAYFNKGNAYMNLEKYEEAIESFKETFKYEQEDSITHLYIARCYEYLNDFDNAVKYYFKSIELNDKQAEAWAGIGYVYHLMGKPYKSIGFIEQALNIEEENPNFIMLLAIVMMDLEKYEEVEKLLLTLMESDPNNIDTAYFLIETFIILEKYDEALDFVEELLTDDPYNKRLLFKKADILYQTKNIKESKKILFSIGIDSIKQYKDLNNNPDSLIDFFERNDR